MGFRPYCLSIFKKSLKSVTTENSIRIRSMKQVCLFILWLGLPGLGAASPLSFEGGYSIMSEMNEDMNMTSFGYTPRWWYSAGVAVESIDQDRIYYSAQFAVLLKRWNMEDAQGNFYVFGGPGYYSNRLGGQIVDDGGFGRLGFRADYETRRIYTAIRYIERRSFEDFNKLDDYLELSAGFAPYLANYTDLNSWLILRLMGNTYTKDLNIFPTMRFFYKTFLWEVGMSTKGRPQLNFMSIF
jgi:hypothetical protein